MASHQDKSIL